MPRTPTFSEIDFRRAIRAARKEGVPAVKLVIGGKELVIPTDPNSPLSTPAAPAPKPEVVL